MKKKFTTVLFLLSFLISQAVTTVVHTAGTTFSPADITVNINDTVDFQLSGTVHNAVEVSQATYTANGTTSNGGFSLPNPGGKVKMTQVGIHYYVCQPHASMGMKGTITVVDPMSIRVTKLPENDKVFYNSNTNSIYISLVLQQASKVSYSIYNISGKKVLSKTSKLPVGQITDEFILNEVFLKGLYIIEIRINDKRYTKKVLID